MLELAKGRGGLLVQGEAGAGKTYASKHMYEALV